LDAVSYNGQSYICKVATSGNLPTITEKWDLMAQKGDTGAKGDTGDTGPAGAKGDTGASGGSTTWKGAYSDQTAYVAFDAVSHLGSSYVCILANTGQPVTSQTHWALLAQKGDTGTAGAKGDTGDTGPAGAAGAKGDKGDTGSTGDTGPAGATGANGSSIVWKGLYNENTAYVISDVVAYNGSSYLCTAASTGT
jgi:hypothetical protein